MNKQTVQLLEHHFDTAFAAPDGIKKLRELILALAMQGKLVAQDPQDQPASELLKEIEAEKRRLVKAGKIKTPKPLPEITQEEVPYELPQGWVWVHMGDIGETNIGLTYAPSDISDTGTPVLRSNNVQGGKLDLSDLKRVDMEIKESALVHDGDLLICARNGSKALVGKTALITGLSEKMAFGAFMAIFRSRINRYLLYFINSPLFRKMIDEVNTMTINQITQGNLKSTIFPLPPLAEQRRIVAKIDQLMARCDELEKLHAEREQKRLTVHTAALNRLLMATKGDDFSTAWRFISQHFGELYSVKDNVAELRKAILQLAVMGKLVPQDPHDQPASALLQEIEAEKQHLVKAGKIKKGSREDAKEINSEEVPYELPAGWVWVRLNELVVVGTGSTPTTTNHEYYNGTIPWYTSSATNNAFAAEPEKFITEKALRETNCKVFPSGSLIIALYGQGKTRGQISEIVTPGATNQAIAAMVFFESSQNLKLYLKYFFIKIYSEIRLLAEGAAQPNLNVGKIKNTLVPLPPLAEQRRIVAKIDQLMAHCDELDKQIEAATGKQTALLNVVMAQV